VVENLRAYREADAEAIELRGMDKRIAGPDPVGKIKRNAARSETITVYKGDDILAITGLLLIHPGMAEIWSVTGKPVDENKVLFAKVSVLVIDTWIRKYGLHRLQANVFVEHERSIEWLEWLGFEREGRMRKFGINGDDFYGYARVK
jgi:hypothetical protein